MYTITIGFCAAAFAFAFGLITLRRKHRLLGWVSLTTATVCAIVALAHLIFGGTMHVTGFSERDIKYFEYKLQYLASYLNATHPGARYLLITYQRTEYSAKRYDMLLAKLKPLDIARIYEEESPEAGLDADMVAAEKMDTIIEKYPECIMVISTFGLPTDYQSMRYWQKAPADRPQLVLLDAYIYDLKPRIKDGTIAAVVQYRPDATYLPNDPIPDDVDEGFAKRYILITPANVDAMDAKYPDLFDHTTDTK